jgi:hypothetical protein
LDRYVWPKWLVPQFRLVASDGYGQSDVDREDQQQMLCATFPGVRGAVRELLGVRMDALARRFHETHDAAVKDEIYRLARDMGRSRSRGFLIHKPNRTLDTRPDLASPKISSGISGSWVSWYSRGNSPIFCSISWRVTDACISLGLTRHQQQAVYRRIRLVTG